MFENEITEIDSDTQSDGEHEHFFRIANTGEMGTIDLIDSDDEEEEKAEKANDPLQPGNLQEASNADEDDLGPIELVPISEEPFQPNHWPAHKGKRGRPPKRKIDTAEFSFKECGNNELSAENELKEEEELLRPLGIDLDHKNSEGTIKRGRGRPPKLQNGVSKIVKKQVVNTEVRKRGRPRKVGRLMNHSKIGRPRNAMVLTKAPRGPVGRPPNPNKIPKPPPGPRGRPPLLHRLPKPPPGPRGRPRKSENVTKLENLLKNPRGRPPKVKIATLVQKRRGRPRLIVNGLNYKPKFLSKDQENSPDVGDGDESIKNHLVEGGESQEEYEELIIPDEIVTSQTIDLSAVEASAENDEEGDQKTQKKRIRPLRIERVMNQRAQDIGANPTLLIYISRKLFQNKRLKQKRMRLKRFLHNQRTQCETICLDSSDGEEMDDFDDDHTDEQTEVNCSSPELLVEITRSPSPPTPPRRKTVIRKSGAFPPIPQLPGVDISIVISDDEEEEEEEDELSSYQPRQEADQPEEYMCARISLLSEDEGTSGSDD